MSVTINWKNQAKNLTSIELYRFDGVIVQDKLDYSKLVTPLATLKGTDETYVDKTVARGKVYTYVLKSIAGKESIVGDPINIGYFPETGPGPKELLRGTWEAGVFGVVPWEEMPTYMDILATSTHKTMTPDVEHPDFWIKCVYDGHIIFVPNKDYKHNSCSLYSLAPEGLLATKEICRQLRQNTYSSLIVPDEDRYVTKNGSYFSIHAPYNTPYTTLASCINTPVYEASMLGRLCESHDLGLFDLPWTFGSLLVVTYHQSSSYCACMYNREGVTITGATSNSYSYLPILDLML